MKVNVSNNSTLSKDLKNLTHQASGTMDFGFCQPIMVDEIEPNSSINLRLGQIIRLTPLAKPTFGDVQLKSYINYVKIEDLFHAFPQLLGGQSYNGVEGSYVPFQVPTITSGFISTFCKVHGKYAVWDCGDVTYISDGCTTRYTLESSDGRPIGVEDYALVRSDVESALVSLFQGIAFYDFSPYFAGTATVPNPTYNTYDPTLSFGALDWAHEIVVGKKSYIVGGRFGQFSKNLFNILNGCGYKFNTDTEQVSILPLFAFYKSWFDLFMPKREMTWSDTNAFHFMELCEQTGISDFVELMEESDYSQEFCDTLIAFLRDLANCYYTQNVDFASAHIDGTANDIVEPGGVVGTIPNDSVNFAFNEIGEQAQIVTGDRISAVELRLLKALDKRVNTASAIGGDLATELKSLYGSNIDLHDSDFIGTQTVSANIDDIMSTAETSEGYLGEYAGQGKGSESGKTFKFSPHDGTKFGYVVVICTVVPTANMSQGMNMQLRHLTPHTFYYEGYDAITLLPTEKKYIYGQVDFKPLAYEPDLNSGFGNIPNYVEYKTHQNTQFGDFCMMSTRDSYLPFTLDKLLPYTQLTLKEGVLTVQNMDFNDIVNGTKWRFVGKYPYIGNYNRIFVQDGDFINYEPHKIQGFLWHFYNERIDGNFIVHNFIDYKKLSPSKSMADSWQTDAYGDKLSIEES